VGSYPIPRCITINGGGPTASDKVVVNGTTGTDAINYAPSSFDAGTVTGLGPTINLATVENLTINGLGGNDALTFTTPSGAHNVRLEPGALPDQGTIVARQSIAAGGAELLGASFTTLGTSGSLTFANTGGTPRQDDLIIDGREFANVGESFSVSSSGVVIVNTVSTNNIRVLVNVNTPGAASLTLNGLGDDDVFTVAANHPFPNGLFINGGDPSASDVLNFTGSAITANLITWTWALERLRKRASTR